jgi:cell division protein FtsI/penicillin-binding protein 2
MKFCTCILVCVLILTACTQSQVVSPTVPPEATQTLKPVIPTIISAPKAAAAAQTFLQAWQAEDYQAMYNMLTPVSQDAMALEKFTQRYSDVAISTTLEKIDFEILSTLTNPSNAQVSYRIVFHTSMLGDLTEEMTMNLSLEKGAWKVQWDDGLIMPELKGGNSLALDLKAPTRGNIYDRNGNAIAVASDVFALGFVKGAVSPEQEGQMLSELSLLTGKDPEWIKALYENEFVYDGTYIPVGEVARDAFMARYDVLSGIAGLYANEYSGRLYLNGGVAPHVTGYVGAIQAEDKDRYLRAGFRIDDRVGMSGLEKWGEKYLLGQRGATLYVNDPQGSPVTRLAQVDSKPSQSITMTIDADLQTEAQKAIAGFSGAAVVLERDTGRVLAMVSSPGFDPNAFEFLNYNSNTLLGTINGDGRARLYNRATSNGYPLGSVFKIITMATALETGIFTAEDTYDCQHYFTEIPGVELKDWTLDKELAPSGVLTLPEGLMRSCNPWFYRIGMELFRQGRTNDLSNMARAFGLGSLTGIEQVFEEPGNIPDPSDELMNARIAIGQSEVLVNPLQVARFVAAVGNGGTLYRPQVVEKIADPDGNATFSFKPEVQSTLPVKLENLAVIQEAMRWVVNDPKGTAVRAFSGFSIPVYGKTGTAETDMENPHAWFAAYTNAGRTDKPDIAIAVIAEYSGDGSAISAPIARRIMEVYFLGQPQRVYPWESRINITRTPTPSETETPQPESGGQSDSGSPGTDSTTPPELNIRTATPSP